LSALHEYRQYRERAERAAPEPHWPQVDLPRGMLPFMTARELLVSFGIPMVSTELAATPDAAVTAAERLGYPVALKIAAAHKSDVGGVVLGCASPAAVRDGFGTIVANARRAGVKDVHGILVQPMASGAVETFAGIVRDRVLGPAVVFGLGGIFVEIVRDTVTEVPPLDFEQARDMVLAIRGRKIL